MAFRRCPDAGGGPINGRGRAVNQSPFVRSYQRLRALRPEGAGRDSRSVVKTLVLGKF
ncbi:hypothetical protein EMIT093MI4_10404 [Pseudomonas sp. IT-93MI4]